MPYFPLTRISFINHLIFHIHIGVIRAHNFYYFMFELMVVLIGLKILFTLRYRGAIQMVKLA